jgi:ubiquinol-cytochrome c reductase cytochrome b subunit
MIERLLTWMDDRLGTAHFVNHALRKAFPDHWSFMLGEINAYLFAILVVTGTILAFFFHPSASETVYRGPYRLLDGVKMSDAYASVLRISFQVNAGLMLRQVHHWAALVFVAGIVAHMARIFITGSFRRPRELNWMIGVTLFAFAMFEGFLGYSLPDDLLSGIGLRIADSVLLSVPVVGTWASFLFLGGAFPNGEIVPRLFVMHVYILPILIAGAIGAHLAVLWRQKHAQFPSDREPRRTQRNVVGSPLFPNYAMKSAALGFATAAVMLALGALVQINPVWLYGPYEPWLALSPAQPDWYIGWLEGALRMGPPWAIHLWGHTIPSPFFPAVLLPFVLFTFLLLWPFIERALTHDTAEHQLLDRPRDCPWRTGLGVALLIFALCLTLAGSDDVQARYVGASVTAITNFYRVAAIIGPVAGFALSYAIARDLRARGGVHKAPRARIRRNEQGGYDEELV